MDLMQSLSQEEDIALMLRVRQDSEAAFAVLHGRYARRVQNFFYGMIGNPGAAADLCQETFLRTWKIRHRYKATGPFTAYLFSIARLIWLERCRELQRQARLGARVDCEVPLAAPADQAPDSRATRDEFEAHFRAALAELPEEQRIVFVLRNIEGMSLHNIAAALDCPINTVRSRKLLAVKKLRTLLAGFASAARPTGG
ncbi:MAG: sigma-70 family RNA polymerase sigma factor [Candidatus Hydrogenedentes bacterium]|nr:sigma-70 family RNA polymerase sigma factor [Candidatus Hydrogenedentota bacterium]